MHETGPGDARTATGTRLPVGALGTGGPAAAPRMSVLPRVLGPAATLRVEGAAILVLATVTYAQLDISWWWFAGLFLAPDVGLAGYAFGLRAGAHLYNLTHTLALPLLLGAAGVLTASTGVVAAALIWAAHIGFDRALGYGLKYTTHFRDTHLQRVA